MKKVLLTVLIVLLVLAAGILLYRHFVTDQIADRGGMENPFLCAWETEIENTLASSAEGRPDCLSGDREI